MYNLCNIYFLNRFNPPGFVTDLAVSPEEENLLFVTENGHAFLLQNYYRTRSIQQLTPLPYGHFEKLEDDSMIIISQSKTQKCNQIVDLPTSGW